MSRPGSVTFVSFMMFVGGVAYLFGAALNVYLWFQPGEVQLFYGAEVSDWYWVINGLLSLFLGVAFIWVGRLALAGDYSAGLTITMLAIINIVFSLFNLFSGYGWVTLLVSILVLALNQSRSAQDWYRRSIV
jgi:hypothetical protein